MRLRAAAVSFMFSPVQHPADAVFNLAVVLALRCPSFSRFLRASHVAQFIHNHVRNLAILSVLRFELRLQEFRHSPSCYVVFHVRSCPDNCPRIIGLRVLGKAKRECSGIGAVLHNEIE